MSYENNNYVYDNIFSLMKDGMTPQSYETLEGLTPVTPVMPEGDLMHFKDLFLAPEEASQQNFTTLESPINPAIVMLPDSVPQPNQPIPAITVNSQPAHLETNDSLIKFLDIRFENQKLASNIPIIDTSDFNLTPESSIDPLDVLLDQSFIDQQCAVIAPTVTAPIVTAPIVTAPAVRAPTVITPESSPTPGLHPEGPASTLLVRGRRRTTTGKAQQARRSSTSSASSSPSPAPSATRSTTTKSRRRQKTTKVYEMTEPFKDQEKEKKRLNAINAKKNRDQKKHQSEEMKRTLAEAIKQRDQLQKDLEKMKQHETFLRNELEKKGITFPCL